MDSVYCIARCSAPSRSGPSPEGAWSKFVVDTFQDSVEQTLSPLLTSEDIVVRMYFYVGSLVSVTCMRDVAAGRRRAKFCHATVRAKKTCKF